MGRQFIKMKKQTMNKLTLFFLVAYLSLSCLSCQRSLNRYLCYEDLGDFHCGLAYAIDSSGKMGFINKRGTLAIPCVYIPRVYDFQNDFSDGECVVSKGVNRIGVIDTSGNSIIPLKYRLVSDDASENIRGVMDTNRIVSYYKKEVCLFSIKGMYPRNFHYGMAYYRDPKGCGFINSHGDVTIPCIYDDCKPFSCGYSLCTLNNISFYIDILNNRYELPKSHKGYDFRNGFAIFECNKKFGAYNIKFDIVIPPIYDNLTMYSNYYIATSGENSKIVRKDKIVWESSTLKIDPYSNEGYFIISDSIRSRGVVDSIGHSIMSDKYDKIYEFHNGFAIVEKKGKQGLVNNKLKLIVPCKFDVCHNVSEGYVLTKRRNKFKYIRIK